VLLLFEYLYNTLIGPKILETEKALMEAECVNIDIKSDGKYLIYCTLIAFLFFFKLISSLLLFNFQSCLSNKNFILAKAQKDNY
jgi:hypothetical protein